MIKLVLLHIEVDFMGVYSYYLGLYDYMII
jgi:hypothetical protein